MHTHEVLEESHRFYQTIIFLQTKMRAFYISGNESLLNDIRSGINKLERTFERLQEMTRDNPIQQKNLETLSLMLQGRITTIKYFIQNKEQFLSKTPSQLKDYIENNEKLIDQIQDQLNIINAEESGLMTIRNNSLIEHSKKLEFYSRLGMIITTIIIIIGVIVLLIQLKILHEVEEKLEHMAQHDKLTGLFNRRYLKIKIKEAMQQSKRHNEKLAIVFVDLDNFKPINDKFGHETGDLVLKKLGKRLLKNVRLIDTVIRQGGDEFVIILSGIHNTNDLETVIEKIMTIIRKKMIINDMEFEITASMGISLYPEHGDNVDTLLKTADQAMYLAKVNGGNNYKIYVKNHQPYRV